MTCRFLMILVGIVAASMGWGDGAPVDFNRDVRAILADNCFHCHGRDANHRKAKLRLDIREEAVAAGAIVPGDAAASELVRRIRATDGDRMPPVDSKRSLTPEQIETLTRWVAEGAAYQPHWAFIPVGETPVPEVKDAAWPRNGLDAFIVERLEREEIAPSAEADKETLLRRVTLGLTGLPPTLSEIDAYLADTSPEAYEKVVERLLAAPAYGERMALDWLDVARYADTFGYQNDVESRVWPWRDWVIGAFNANMPYDQFITWQLAGDLIPDATDESRLATAFNRLHRQTNEGGSIPEEFRVEYVADRTRTFSTAFLGLNMECARCHDHKFDPISQKEYYETFAFFDDIDECGLYSHFTPATPTPAMVLMTDADRALQKAHEDVITAANAKMDEERKLARERFIAWLKDPARALPVAAPVIHLPLDEMAEGKTANAAQAEKAATVESEGVTLVEGVAGQAMTFSGDHALAVPDGGQFERTQPFSLSLWVKTAAHAEHLVVAHCTTASLDAGSRGYELLLEHGRPTFGLTHFWPGNAIRVEARDAIPVNQWVHVGVTYDGSSSAAGVALYVNGVTAAVDVVRDGLTRTILYESGQPSLTFAARFRDTGFTGGAIDELQVFDRALTKVEMECLSWCCSQSLADTTGDADESKLSSTSPLPPFEGGEESPLHRRLRERVASHHADVDEELFEYFLSAVDQPYRDALAVLRAARDAENAFVSALPEIMVMRDLPAPRVAHVLARGAYDAPAEAVEPDTPESIMPFSPELPRNRLGLAQWVTDPKNPLTARVAVNRYWQMFFGRGLVETQEDFGTQGRPPTHPELLDWLAGEFVQSGWDVKALHRLIVTSATFRQDSNPRDELMERDPANALLARGPRLRLPAEVVRDEALAASGLLVAKVGGPSVKPYQPGDLWKDASQVTYVEDTGEGLYRRSMYTYWKRTVPPPTMLTFDAPTREFCQVRREVTATPLQSLILLNDVQYVEAARVLAAKVMAVEGVDARLTMAFRELVGRHPDVEEAEILRAAYEEQAALYAGNVEGAAAYASAGAAVKSETQDAAELAAMTAVAQMIMNLNEFVVVE